MVMTWRLVRLGTLLKREHLMVVLKLPPWQLLVHRTALIQHTTVWSHLQLQMMRQKSQLLWNWTCLVSWHNQVFCPLLMKLLLVHVFLFSRKYAICWSIWTLIDRLKLFRESKTQVTHVYPGHTFTN